MLVLQSVHESILLALYLLNELCFFSFEPFNSSLFIVKEVLMVGLMLVSYIS